jgi:hypothetical protein
MPFIDYETCEPLRVWGRFEPRSRAVDFDRALAARVHDPLWMLTRQWLMGEFQGEDAGSAVLAKLARRVTPIARYEIGGRTEAEDGSLPAELRIERLPVDFAPIRRAQLGRTFLLHLDEAAAAAAPVVPFPRDEIRRVLREHYGVPPDAAPGDAVDQAAARVAGRARRTTAALAGRAIDGVRLHEALVAAAPALPGVLVTALAPEHAAIAGTAAERFRAWFESLHPAGPGDGWNPTQLEYQAACTVPTANGTVRLSLAEHVSGRLDWPAFDQDGVTPGPSASVTDVRTVIPAPAEFAGMPNPRWWQFEDAAVDLGNFRARATDLARIVVAEFALVYGNNWFVVPYHQRVGTLAEIQGIVVTDVFGQRTLVGPAVSGSSGSWTSWDLFSLSPRGTNGVAPALGQHLFLPPALGTVAEADPHESVTLVRDEAANMVWGIERRIADGLGGSRDGVEAARRFTEELRALLDQAGDRAAPAAALRYLLGTDVSESWVPFLPVHVGAGTREIQLQRAALLRFLQEGSGPQPVVPRTSILSYGLDGSEELEPYLIDEEEVPRTGVTVSGALRRARWIDGRTVVWHARGVTTGRGEVDSGLRFDVVEPVSAE